ncbi:protoporphyrinogen oxidase [Virgibacillus alimentarius]|uniref:Coproporphyrinogen III oxidase n=1 Tax=Virgibacillus alimentarius TaxID=698769 RepID=A0ABS4SBF3_9BACI|nr:MULTISPECIES: protoporphyrinogen oxidase [Virgibacillus]MBP2258823.1 oxygen-dependent protoporphyrinogen oxidase [Virgibacillus alimentarius]HLR65778.1 protoporphyrinogen oxidase [Virgibacillus sp.]
MNNTRNIVIVGGGITGLSAAYYLQKEIKQKNLPYTVKLVEAGDHLGGKIQTVKKDGFTIERGPDSFLERKKSAGKLAEELGMTDQLVRNGTGQAYILVRNKLHKMPKGSYMGVPTQMKPFLFSSLLSLPGKLRTTLDFFIPKSKEKDDQSLGSFFRRRFGNELVENLLEPLLSGIYSGDIDKMSLMATFPNFHELEQTHRSLIKGLRTTMPERKRNTGKKSGQFLAFKNGFESVVDELKRRLNKENIISLNKVLDHVEKKEQGYHLLLSNGEVYKADTVIMATPHSALPKVFSQYDIFKKFHDIPMSSVANVALAFDQSAIKKDVNGTGFVVSRNSNFRITACTWTHKKWPHTTPEGKVLLRCYVGKPNDQEIVGFSDEQITNIVLKDLKKTLKIKGEPAFTVVTRWKNVMPQYTVGHTERIAKVRQEMSEQLPGVFLAGSSYEGVGIPDCITQGEQAVENVLAFLQKKA